METIKIRDEKKGVIEMEIVLTYDYKDNNYVIYKDNKDLYIAKYNYDNELLNTDLKEEEISFGEKVLKEVLHNAESK